MATKKNQSLWKWIVFMQKFKNFLESAIYSRLQNLQNMMMLYIILIRRPFKGRRCVGWSGESRSPHDPWEGLKHFPSIQWKITIFRQGFSSLENLLMKTLLVFEYFKECTRILAKNLPTPRGLPNFSKCWRNLKKN